MKPKSIKRAWRTLACSAVFALACSPAWAAQASAKQVRELMDVFGVNRMFQQMNTQMAGMMGQQLPCVPASYWNNFLDEKGMQELSEKMIPIYQRHFSAEDIDGLLKFYRSPLGRKVVAEMPATMAEGMQVGQQWGRERGQAMMEQLQKAGTITGEGHCPATAPAQPVLSKPAAKPSK
ncbi:DUF2059 domain-containing protein [Dyella ginsengisoli]|uniref:DUF2059 domain-containing protein n=1 Tax=Dyella ginsengisoli TaxID=363848 RepID=A0ABW8JWS7_9GAMM